MFRLMFGITGVLVFALGLVLIFAPRAYLSLYVPEFEDSMGFAAQRLAPAILGLGAVLVLLRDLQPGRLAQRFAILTALVWFGVAGTGVYHYSAGIATGGILVAAASEIFLGLLFLWAGRAMRP